MSDESVSRILRISKFARFEPITYEKHGTYVVNDVSDAALLGYRAHAGHMAASPSVKLSGRYGPNEPVRHMTARRR